MKKKMGNKSFFRKESLMDKRAVSPVIGEILMVAIVVIIAAVIAVFIFGIIQTTKKAPNVQLEATAYTTNLTLKHTSGDPINLDECVVRANGDTLTITGSLTVGYSISSTGGYPIDIDEGEAVTVEVVHLPSECYILDTVVTAR